MYFTESIPLLAKNIAKYLYRFYFAKTGNMYPEVLQHGSQQFGTLGITYVKRRFTGI
ncbi:MAG: hypothetical protein U0Z17_03675 [Bacteroidales bacterium]